MNEALYHDLAERLGASRTAAQDYTVEKTLKETESECTELVRDAEDKRWIRKLFLRDDPTIERSYRAIQQAQSPYLPRIHDLHRSAAGTVVVREYFAGPTLREWVQQYGSLDDEQARTALACICRSVQALHRLEPPLIHRDINPNNVIVALDGPKLIDFGIARAYDKSANRDTHNWGTTGYAAPEQFGFDQSDERTDVFALGMLYWFLLTGRDPEGNLGAQLRQETDASIPESARNIISNCVALAPEARYRNVDELASALEGTGQTHPLKSETPSSHGLRTTRPIRKALGKTWRIVSNSFMAFLVFAITFTLAEPWRLSVPEGWAHAALFCFGLLLMFAPAWLFTTNLFRVRDRLPLLRKHKLLRDVIIVLVTFIAGALIANAATTDLPAAYVQLMQQHGATSI